MSSGVAVEETAIKSLGELAIGRLSAQHYDFNHQSPKNRGFVKAYNAEFKRNPDFFSVEDMTECTSSMRRKKDGGKADVEVWRKLQRHAMGESGGPMLIDRTRGM